MPNHYATPEMRRYATLRAARKAIVTAAAGVLLIGLVTGGVTLTSIMRTAEGDQRTAREVMDLNRQYDQLSRSMPSFDIGAEAMRDAVTFYAGFIQGFPSVGTFVVPLSAALEKHPSVRLNQLAWQATDDPRTTPTMTPQAARVPPPVKAAVRGGEAATRSPAAEDASAQAFAGGHYEVAFMEAMVSASTHDFRGALAEVESLATDIRAIKGYQAEVVESPLDVRPSAALQGRNVDREAGTMEARFLLRIVRARPGTA